MSSTSAIGQPPVAGHIQTVIRRFFNNRSVCETDSCEECFALLTLDGESPKKWEILFSLLRKETSCSLLQEWKRVLYGNIVTVSFCIECYRYNSGPSGEEFHIEEIKGPINYNSFRFNLKSSRLCEKHKIPKVDLRCFGDLPCFGLVSAPCTGASLYVAPVTFLRPSEEEMTLSYHPSSTLFGKSLFIGNPCYEKSWRMQKATVLATFSQNLHLVQFRAKPQPESEWNLQEVSEGLPFRSNSSGKQKILTSISLVCSGLEGTPVFLCTDVLPKRTACDSSSERSDSFNQKNSNVSCAPTQNTITTFAGKSNKEPKSTLMENPSSFNSNSFSTGKLSTARSEGKKEEETIEKPRARNDLSQRKNDLVPLSTSSNRTSSNRTRTTSSSTFSSGGRTVVNRPALQHDLEGEYRVPTCILDDFDADTHCIPFLYASFNLLERIEHTDNYHYQAPSANGLSLEDATEQYQNSIDNVFTDGCSLSSCVRRKVSYNRSSVLPTTPGISLKLVVDIDSIDFVTIPWGGSAFRTACKILLRFETRYQEPENYLTPNNNLVHFPSNKMRMREKYFLNHRVKKFDKNSARNRENRGDAKPIAFKVFDIRLRLSYEPVSVRAMVPESMVIMALSGGESLLQLFHQKKSGPQPQDSYQTCFELHKFFWYLVGELLLFISRLCTRSGNYGHTSSRQVCCAIPGKGNKHNHDRANGFDSSFGEGLILEETDTVIVQLMATRFLAFIEQNAEVPHDLRVFNKYAATRYGCPEYVLNHVEDDRVRACLRSDIYSDQCFEFFRSVLSDREECLGNLLTLKSDETRREETALPNTISNRNALENEVMCLEDLLLLCPVEFRCTGHGFKERLMTRDKVISTRKILSEEINVSGLEDGMIDVALTLQGPLGSSFAINLPYSCARHSKLLVPAVRSKNSMKMLRGLLYSGAGYPEFYGFSTEKGLVNEPLTSLCARGVRRVKVYSTKRRTEATRGATVYESTGRKLYAFLTDYSDRLRTWLGCRAERESQTRSQCVAEEKEVNSLFKTLMHDTERRLKNAKSAQDSIGIRVELTYALNFEWNAFDAAIYLLGLQEERREMDVSAFEEEKLENPGKWPWWLDLPHEGGDEVEISKSRLLPVTILKSGQFLKFTLGVESHILRSAFNLYCQSRHFLTNENMDPGSETSSLLTDILGRAPANVASMITMITVRGLLSAARTMVVSFHCRRSNACFIDASPMLTALGLDLTLFLQGYPAIVLPRLLFLHDLLPKVFLHLPYNPGSRVLAAIRNDERPLENIIDDLEDGLKLSKTTSFRHQITKPNFLPNVIGSHSMPAPPLGIVGNHSPTRRFLRVQDIIQEVITGSSSGSEMEEVIMQLAVIVTRFLVSDVFLELDIMLGLKPPTLETRFHESRMYPEISMESVKSLSRLVQGDDIIPQEARLTQLLSNQRATHANEVNDLLSFYERGLYTHLLGNGDNDNQSESRNNTSISVNRFIHSLWNHSKMLPHYSEIDPRDLMLQDTTHRKHAFHKWRSVLALRVIDHEFISAEELYEKVRRSKNIRHHRQLFYTKFPDSFKRCLKAFGFFRVCPKIIEDLFPSNDRTRVRIWGPQPVFGKLEGHEPLVSLVPQTTQASSIRQVQRSSSDAIRDMTLDFSYLRVHKLDTLTTWLRDISKTLTIEKERSEYERCQVLDNISRKLWSNSSDIRRLFMDIISERKGKDMSPHTFEWSCRVMELLIDLRCNMQDEGYAVYEIDGKAQGLSERGSYDCLPYLGSIYTSERELMKSPWSSLRYPSAQRTREGKTTKNILVKQGSRLLWSTGLVFKVDASSFPGKPRKNGNVRFERYITKSVRDVYWNHRCENRTTVCSSHAMWRLVPDAVVVQNLLRYLEV
ncbi:hypothetical protein FGB62_382g015 [Gracilaria domingensis]|nr:hypothetical protein FGB62_382g015 [Gracilaria domingensis]